MQPCVGTLQGQWITSTCTHLFWVPGFTTLLAAASFRIPEIVPAVEIDPCITKGITQKTGAGPQQRWGRGCGQGGDSWHPKQMGAGRGDPLPWQRPQNH